MTSYQKGDISVDRDFARLGSKSYAINKINTVDVRERPAKQSTAVSVLIVGLLCFWLNSWLGIAVVALGIYLWAKAKPSYRLFLMTSSNDVQAYESNDRSEVMELRYAIEGAMTGR